MIDYQAAVAKALYDRLAAEVSLADVFQHVPEDTPPPVVIVGDVSFEDIGTKDAPLFRFDISIVSVVAGPGRKPLDAVQAQVNEAINRWKPTATTQVEFGEVRLSSGSGQLIAGTDGDPIYYGDQQASVLVTPR